MNKHLLILSLALSLMACSVLPEPEKAPRQLLLSSLQPSGQLDDASDSQIRLAIERPLASTPLRQREIWYRDTAVELMPFSRYVWAESLDLQIQNLTVEYLAQQPWSEAVSLDLSGFRADYRLRLNLQHWYLDTTRQKLILGLQANLLDHQGNSLFQKQWRDEQPVTQLSPKGVAEASQDWLETWILALNQSLNDYWNQ